MNSLDEWLSSPKRVLGLATLTVFFQCQSALFEFNCEIRQAAIVLTLSTAFMVAYISWLRLRYGTYDSSAGISWRAIAKQAALGVSVTLIVHAVGLCSLKVLASVPHIVSIDRCNRVIGQLKGATTKQVLLLLGHQIL